MSAIEGNSSSGGASIAKRDEKNIKWQQELLMERLRSKAGQHKSFPDLSKAIRMSMLEKRYALDAVEKASLQKCLDSMQRCIKVTTRQGLVERLESLSRQLGFQFVENSSGLFISCDMFCLEILLSDNGIVNDVNVYHECKIEQRSCAELVDCLAKCDFIDFTAQLEGLGSIYQLNAEPKIKIKAFEAIHSLEEDLNTLYSALQPAHMNPYELLVQSSVGILQKRRGGHPMKLTFFVSPYDLLDLAANKMLPLSVDIINTKNIGKNVTVNLEASASKKLQIAPTISINETGQLVNSPIGPNNSIMLPANFLLKLNKPMPICAKLAHEIQSAIDMKCNTLSGDAEVPLLGLITRHASNNELNSSTRGLFVTLPDQNHCYFLTENQSLQGYVITGIPFTEPSQVPKVLAALRQQELFNTLIASCVRVNSNKQDIESTKMFEVIAISHKKLSISLEHPFEESLVTIEINLSNFLNLTCSIYPENNASEAMSLKLSKVLQQCFSIPVTLRAYLKYCDQEQLQKLREIDANENFNMQLETTDDFSADTIKQEPMDQGSNNGSSMNQFSNMGSAMVNESDSVKRRRMEDFWCDPKSDQYNQANSNSDSLGSSLITSSGVANNAMGESSRTIDLFDELKESTTSSTIGLSSINASNISPVRSSLNSLLSGSGLEMRPGIEILPVQMNQTRDVPTSITITPIPSKSERKSTSSSGEKKSDEKAKAKKKRKKEDSSGSMGPPDKVFSKSNLGESSKSGGSSQTMTQSVSVPHLSPKQLSPRSGSSPLGDRSPRGPYTITSPKHSPGSGKPSMQTLKSATNSPSRSYDKYRDKDKSVNEKDRMRVDS